MLRIILIGALSAYVSGCEYHAARNSAAVFQPSPAMAPKAEHKPVQTEVSPNPDAKSEGEAQPAEKPVTVVLPEPPWKHMCAKEVVAADKNKPPKLVELRTKRNKIIDEEAWFSKYQLHGEFLGFQSIYSNPANRPSMQHAADEGVAVGVRINPGQDRQLIIENSGGDVLKIYDFTRYGFADFSAITAKNQPFGENDGEFEHGPVQDIRSAEINDGVLYVAHANHNYAADSGGRNAYLTAIDLATDELLWRSDPLVANSSNFVIHGDFIISGYWFTAEPDYLYVISRKNGRVVGRKKVASAPDYLFMRGNILLVRTYDHDYEFALR